MKRKELEAAIAAGTPLALKPSTYSSDVEPIVAATSVESGGRRIGVTIVGKSMAPRRMVAISSLCTLAEAESIISERRSARERRSAETQASFDVAERLSDLLGRPYAVGACSHGALVQGGTVAMDRATAERIAWLLEGHAALAGKLDSLADEADREVAYRRRELDEGKLAAKGPHDFHQGKASAYRYAAHLLRSEESAS